MSVDVLHAGVWVFAAGLGKAAGNGAYFYSFLLFYFLHSGTLMS